jgi:hypothetical protein
MRKCSKRHSLVHKPPTLPYLIPDTNTQDPLLGPENPLCCPLPPPPGGGGGEGDGGMESRCEESGTGPLSVDPWTPSHPLLSSLSLQPFCMLCKKIRKSDKTTPCHRRPYIYTTGAISGQPKYSRTGQWHWVSKKSAQKLVRFLHGKRPPDHKIIKVFLAG